MILDVVKYRYVYIGFSLGLMVFSLFLLLGGEKKLGIDMTGGTQIEYTYEGNIDLKAIDSHNQELMSEFNKLHDNIINGITVYPVTGEKKIVIETGFNRDADEKNLIHVKEEFKKNSYEKLINQNKTFHETKYVDIGQSFGDYIKKTAYLTLFISIIGISIYIAFAFYGVASGVSSSTFAIVTLLTSIHDVLVATGCYIFVSLFFSEFKIDTFFITALLTILGFSINDTIVVFDRIRENIKRHIKNYKIGQIINMSVNETLQRSLFTSLTLFFVLITIFIFGPELLRGFMLTLIFGVLFGTYSSIFVASPIIYEIYKNKILKNFTKVEVKEEDKIVV